MICQEKMEVKMANRTHKRPATLTIAEHVHEEKCPGKYIEAAKTWSNRSYTLASTKKHNEDM